MAARYHGHLITYLAVAATPILLSFSLAPPLAAGDRLTEVCGTSDNYTANSPFEANIQSLAAALPTNASASSTLFDTAKLGAVPDIVYALALCRGDVNASACASCVATAFVDAQRLCALNKDATVYYDLCLLRYSNQNFLSFPTSDGRGNNIMFMDTQTVTAPVSVIDDAVAVLLNATAEYAAANSSRRFGTGVVGFQSFDSRNPRIYGLAQCTPDMAQADCRACLSGMLQLTLNRFSGKTGGRILTLRCNYRYQQYAFFSGSPLVNLPEPPVGAPPPAAKVTPPAAGGG